MLDADISFDTLAVATVLTGAALASHSTYRMFLKRVSNINKLPHYFLTKESDRTLYGRCTWVGDGDNFRFYHTPGGVFAGWGWLRRIPTQRSVLSKETLHIRVAGVDAPECAHFGKPAQPYGPEALQWLRNYLTGCRVRIQPHSRDRFDRVVATALVRKWPMPFIRRSVGEEMVRNGMADVFDQSGAEYGGPANERRLRRLLARAQARRVGMWAGKPGPRSSSARRGWWASLFSRKTRRAPRVETPAEFKRRHRDA